MPARSRVPQGAQDREAEVAFDLPPLENAIAQHVLADGRCQGEKKAADDAEKKDEKTFHGFDSLLTNWSDQIERVDSATGENVYALLRRYEPSLIRESWQ